MESDYMFFYKNVKKFDQQIKVLQVVPKSKLTCMSIRDFEAKLAELREKAEVDQKENNNQYVEDYRSGKQKSKKL